MFTSVGLFSLSPQGRKHPLQAKKVIGNQIRLWACIDCVRADIRTSAAGSNRFGLLRIFVIAVGRILALGRYGSLPGSLISIWPVASVCRGRSRALHALDLERLLIA